MIELAQELEALGADGILSVTPYYNKPTQEGLYQHYKAIADAVDLPIVVYSVQGRTGVNVEPATLKRLAEIDNIVGVKEASGNIGQMAHPCIHAVPDAFVCSPVTTPSPFRVLGARRQRADLGGLERDSGRDEPTAQAAYAMISRRRAIPADYLPLMDVNLRRIESDSGQSRDGDDGPAGAGLAAAACAARSRSADREPKIRQAAQGPADY